MDLKTILRAYAWFFVPLLLAVLLTALTNSDASATLCTGAFLAGIVFWVFVFPAMYKAR